ncbi:hypothetical protein BDSB_06985 [Burkholderia dolosa PC543]|nr:hypothetical protein BDSB_06985 [Burkholderia dolosa PC543]
MFEAGEIGEHPPPLYRPSAPPKTHAIAAGQESFRCAHAQNAQRQRVT